MENKLENKLIMLKTVLSVLHQNQAIWMEVAPLVAAYAELQLLVAQIESAKQLTAQTNSGLVTANQQLQKRLIEQAFELASMLFAYASRNNDPVLLAKVDFPVSQLRNLRDDELATKCLSVLTLGRNKEEALVEYGTTPEKLSMFGELTNQYVEQLPNRRVSVAERKAANEKIKNMLFGAMAITTEQLDRLMIGFKTTHLDFYAAYLNARKVIDYGTRHETPGTSPNSPVAP